MVLFFIVIAIIIFLLSYAGVFLTRKVISNVSGSTGKTFDKFNASLIAIVLTILVSLYWVYKPDFKNYKYAQIEREKGNEIITVFGKRKLMVDDPFSLLQGKTYEDSMKFVVPRPQGIISAVEVLNKDAGYRYSKGSIAIDGVSMKIDLYYMAAYDSTIIPSGWNNSYELKRTK